MIYRSSFQKNKIYFHLAVQISDHRLNPARLHSLWQDLANRIQRHHFLRAHSCVLMSNHFHGIFEVPEICYEMAEAVLKAEFQQVQEPPLNIDSGSSLRMVRIHCFAAFREVYRYVYRNPVEAGICSQAQHYTYSTLGELMGIRKPLYYVADSMGVITNPFSILDWIHGDGAKTASSAANPDLNHKV